MRTRDDFLGGRVHLWQDQQGLRATSDSVLLAAAVQAKPGESVLDVGTGTGVVAVCLNARVPGIMVTGVDCQPDLVELAVQNARENGCVFEGITADLSIRPSPIHARLFHHVVTNPPFYDEGQLRRESSVAKAYHQEISLTEWLRFCLRHIRAKGTLTVIHRPSALGEILAVLNKRLGAIEVIPVASRSGEAAKRVIIRGRMDSRQPLAIRPPLVMHTLRGGRSRTAEKILRLGHGIE